jgi:hypothetical protein
MLSFAPQPCVSIGLVRSLAGAMACLLAGAAFAAEQAGGEFGKDIQLAPFVVQGKPLSISIHARTKGDRRYAEKFADEVIEVAYETLGDSTGKGLIIVGVKAEPHPVVVIRKFLAMAAAGQLDPAVAANAGALAAKMADWGRIMGLGDDERDDDGNDDPKEGFKITFDMIVPALPLPLEGVASKLYQLSWAEGFDEARVEKQLRALTVADLESDALSKYDWVFYLPPRNAYIGVQNEVMKQAMKQEKMGLMKRAAIKSALVVFKPAIRKAVEGFRKGMLFMAVLRARSDYSQDDIKYLTQAYTNVLMPDFKFNGGSERERALEAIEKQKVANAEYAKDPFVKPERLATFDPAVYAAGEGDYTLEPPQVTHRFKREGDVFQWNYKDHQPMIFFPAGDRLLVKEDGSMTIRFLVDDAGTVTGVEERWVRRRQTVPRKA